MYRLIVNLVTSVILHGGFRIFGDYLALGVHPLRPEFHDDVVWISDEDYDGRSRPLALGFDVFE